MRGAISPQLNLRGSRDYTLEFVLYGPLYKNRGINLSHFNRGGPTKFEKNFTQISILRYLRPFLTILYKISDLKKNLRRRVFKRVSGPSQYEGKLHIGRVLRPLKLFFETWKLKILDLPNSDFQKIHKLHYSKFI